MAGGVDVAAANAAGFIVKGDDDLQIIESIGPKIFALLIANCVPIIGGLNSEAFRTPWRRVSLGFQAVANLADRPNR